MPGTPQLCACYNMFFGAAHAPDIEHFGPHVTQPRGLLLVLVWLCLAMFCGLQTAFFVPPPVLSLVSNLRISSLGLFVQVGHETP
jgi:hypothetical protein